MAANSAAWYAANKERALVNCAEYYKNNKEKKNAQSSAWRKSHPGQHQQFVQNWINQNREQVREKKREWYEQNAEDCRQNAKDWKEKHPHEVRIQAHNRRATIKENGGKISSDLWQILLAEQDGQCPYCFADLYSVGFHLDHFMPLALGGANEDWNIQLTCPSCNWKKHDTHPADFLKQVGIIRA